MKKLFILGTIFLVPFTLQGQNLDWRVDGPYKKADLKGQLATRLSNYVMQDTSTPSAQNKFAKQLAKELRSLGVQQVKVSKKGVVTAEIPANVKTAPTLTFIAQTQTQAANNVKPQTHKNYTGGEIMLRAEPRVTLDKYNAPQLTRAYGHDLITGSGTALGADTKSAVTVLMQAVEFLDQHPAVSHGTIKLAFIPSIAQLTQADADYLKADYIYALGSEDLGELANETFSARRFTVSFEGNRNVELGTAANSAFADNVLIASDFHTLLPRHMRPDTTSGNRGFIYVDSITHNGNTSQITGEVRAFSQEDLQSLSQEVTRAFNTVKALHHKAKNFNLSWQDSAQNIKPNIPNIVLTQAQNAMRAEDITPQLIAVRTENLSSQLVPFGLFAPSLFTGHYNAQQDVEYVDLDVMESSFRTVMRLITDTILPVKK